MDPRFYDISAPLTLDALAGIALAEKPAAGGAKIVSGIAALEDAGPSEASFLDFSAMSKGLDKSAEYKEKLKSCKAGACFVKPESAGLLPPHITALVSADPRMSYMMAAGYFYRDRSEPSGISPHAVIAPTAKIGEDVSIGPFAVIGEGVEIGPGTRVHPHAVITHAIVGARCAILEGAVIGSAGFGWHSGSAGHKWVPQLGRVILGDDVFVGACACIDRGASGDTTIGDGTKLDALVKIGHNCRIGRHCVFAGMSGVAGSTAIGDWVLLGAQSGVSGHLKIGSFSQIGAGAGVIQDLPEKSFVSGYPALPVRDFLKQAALLRRMVKKGTSA